MRGSRTAHVVGMKLTNETQRSGVVALVNKTLMILGLVVVALTAVPSLEPIQNGADLGLFIGVAMFAWGLLAPNNQIAD